MTASASYDPRRTTGFRLDQLAMAFDRVRNSRNWQAPVRAVISEEDRAVVELAVLWFTESIALFEPIAERPGYLTVAAPGFAIGTACPEREGAPATGLSPDSAEVGDR